MHGMCFGVIWGYVCEYVWICERGYTCGEYVRGRLHMRVGVWGISIWLSVFVWQCV